MANRKKTNAKKRGGLNLSIILIIVALIAILSYAISYLFIHNTSTDDELTNQRHQAKVENTNRGNSSINSPIYGSWYSSYDGTILTITGNTFKMESANVDENKTVHGTILINGSEIIFMNDSTVGICTDLPGKYSWKVENSETLTFIKINDSCTSRVDRMTGGWEKF